MLSFAVPSTLRNLPADTPAAFSPALDDTVDVMLASARWEDQLGALTAITVLLYARTFHKRKIPASNLQILYVQAALEACGSEDLAVRLLEPVLAKLEAEEPRVRLAVGDCLLAMALQLGPLVWERSGTAILASIRRCWVRRMSRRGVQVNRLFKLHYFRCRTATL